MKKLRLMTATLPLAAIALWIPFQVSAAETKSAPAEVLAARIMPAEVPDYAELNEQIVDEKNANLLRPIKCPPFGNHSFPEGLAHKYEKKDQTVSITSDKNILTIRWEPVRAPIDADVDNIRAPFLDVSTTYSFDLKTGKISVTNCLEVCQIREISFRKTPKEFIKALCAMLEKVSGAIRTPRLSNFTDRETYKKLILTRNTLHKIIMKIS